MASRDEINAEFYAGYGDQPRGMTLMDYLSPSSYVDPYKSLRNPAQVMPQNNQTQTVTPVANSGSNFNIGNLTNYIPSASTIGEYIPTSLPNVFGVNNPLYAGLLGDPQAQALSKQSNVAGLLSAAAALVQGMGKQGGRRSAAQNIISALGAGYGSAGQAYQQGLQSYGQAQQLALQQRQQAGKPTVVSEGGTLVSPTGEVLYSSTKNKPQARMLSADEVATYNLPTSGGQKYQVDANGKIDLIQGTAPDKPATSIEEYKYYLSRGGKKDYETFKKDTAQQQNLSFTLPSDPAKRAQALSENSQKFTANKPITESFEVANRYDNFSKAYNNPQAGGASDAVLIYSMAKMLDPGGAVQQSDVGTIAGQKSIPEKLKSIHEQFISNRILSDEQRENLNAMAYSIVKNKQKSISPIIKQYRNYANALASPDPMSDVQDPFQNIEFPKKRLVTINNKKTQVRLGNDGNYYYTDPTGKNYIYND